MSAAAATEVEAHAADSPPRRRLSGRNHGDNCLTVLLVVLLLLIVGGVVFFVVDSNTRPRYSVAIDAVSGLDPAATGDDGRGPTLDPVFDLTVSISPRSRVRGTDCYEPGTTVEVNYHGVLLASGPVEQLCARATKTGRGRAVAWGTGVRLPGFVLDALVSDVRRGGVEATGFDVTVKIPVHRRWRPLQPGRDARVVQGEAGRGRRRRCVEDSVRRAEREHRRAIAEHGEDADGRCQLTLCE